MAYFGALAPSIGAVAGGVGAGLAAGAGGDDGGVDSAGGSAPMPVPPLLAASLQPPSANTAALSNTKAAAFKSQTLAADRSRLSRKSRGWLSER
jgi:hypothetical protein